MSSTFHNPGNAHIEMEFSMELLNIILRKFVAVVSPTFCNLMDWSVGFPGGARG